MLTINVNANKHMKPTRQNHNIDRAMTAVCKKLQKDETLTIQDIAEKCGCSRQYVQKLEKSGLDKLRRYAAEHGLRDFWVEDDLAFDPVVLCHGNASNFMRSRF